MVLPTHKCGCNTREYNSLSKLPNVCRHPCTKSARWRRDTVRLYESYQIGHWKGLFESRNPETVPTK